MFITIASNKGGVGKTTTAVHLADYLNAFSSTLLVDADRNRSAMTWARTGSLPFMTVTENQMPKHIRAHEHVVIDTQARPEKEDLRELAAGCDLLILPTTPKMLDLDALLATVDILNSLNAASYRALITMAHPAPSKSAVEARKLLQSENVPLFDAQIRRLVAFERSPIEGVVVHQCKDKNARIAWKGYQRLGDEVMALIGAQSLEAIA